MLTAKGYILMLLYIQVIRSEQTGSMKNLQNVIDTQRASCLNITTCNLPANAIRQKLNISSVNLIWQNQKLLHETPCCEECSCIPYSCISEGTCCPEMFTRYEEFSEASIFQSSFCKPLQLKPRYSLDDNKTYPNTDNSVVMTTKCPDRYYGTPRKKRDYVKEMCENDEVNDVLTKVPVTHTLSLQTFGNKYCAECFGFTEEYLDFWDLKVACIGSTIQPLNTDDILRQVLQKNECNIFFQSEKWLSELKGCFDPISECNVTGRWTNYDPVIEKACSAYSAPYKKRYRNVFCYMCNGNRQDLNINDCRDDYVVIDRLTSSFAVLIGYKELESLRKSYDVSEISEKQELCRGNTFFDPLQQSCVEIYCQYPKIYLNGSCINFGSKIGGVGYRVFLQLTPTLEDTENATTEEGQMNGMKDPNKGTQDQMSSVEEKIDKHFVEWFNVTGLAKYIYKFSVHTKRNDVANSTSYYVVYFELYLSTIEPGDITLIDKVHEMHDRVIQFECCGLVYESQKFIAQLEYFDIVNNAINETHIIKWDLNSKISSTLDKVLVREYEKPYSLDFTMFNTEDTIYLLPTHSCPLVTLSSFFYGIRHYPWGVSFKRLSIQLSKSKYIVKKSGLDVSDISVCKDTFDKIQECALESNAPRRCEVYIINTLLCFYCTLYAFDFILSVRKR